MKKTFTALAVLIVIVLLLLTAAYCQKTEIVSRFLSRSLGTRVLIDEVLLKSPSFVMKKLLILNPASRRVSPLFESGLFEIEMPFGRYFDRDVVIDRITLTDNILYLTVNADGSNNWSPMMKQLQQAKPTTKTKTKPVAKKKEKGAGKTDTPKVAKSVTINRLEIINLRVVISVPGQPVQEKVIAKIVLNNLTTKDNRLLSTIMHAVLSEVLFNAKDLLRLPLEIPSDLMNKPLKQWIPFFKKSST